MAVIDIRHLVKKEYDVVKFTGDIDHIDYTIPVKKTINSILLLQDAMTEFNKNHDVKNLTQNDIIEIGYITLSAWIRSYYPDLTLEWVKNNISEEVFIILSNKAEELFFPNTKSSKQLETVKPIKKRKSRKS